jgi:predicted porin
MKKSLLALAVLGGFAGVASAQSSVTLYGTLDLSAKYVKNDGSARRYSLSQDGINSSQLGFRGVEDLGGGLKASFVLLAGINADTGTANGKFWNRRSTVSLSGGFGEVRLGRDYTPTFWNNTIFDAFGTNGLGDSTHVQQLATATFVRADNSIGYFLPSNIGGVYGQFMAAAAEGGDNLGANGQQLSATSIGATCKATAAPNAGCTAVINSNPGRYIGGRIGFAAGPFDIAAAYAQQKFASLAGTSQKTANIGGSYDLGVVKLMGYFDRDTLSFAGVDRKENRGSFSAVVPLGQGEIHAGYSLSKLTNNGASTKIDQVALGYVYNLSKRTALYSTASRVNNKNATSNSVAGGTAITAAPTAGGKSTGFEAGLRHFF